MTIIRDDIKEVVKTVVKNGKGHVLHISEVLIEDAKDVPKVFKRAYFTQDDTELIYEIEHTVYDDDEESPLARYML